MGRRRAAAKRLETDEYWKEMWDDDKRRPFYYNMHTGETRFRKPQALLNLEYRPSCNDCSIKVCVGLVWAWCGPGVGLVLHQ